MKFGSELNDRSIIKWRNYNIDYNDLKSQIKLATTDNCFNPTNRSIASTTTNSTVSNSQSSSLDDDNSFFNQSQTTANIQKRQRQLLHGLYKSFKDQIEFVSLFVNSKYGEIQRRLSIIKNQLNNFINLANKNSSIDENKLETDLNKRLLKRRLLSINKELNDISIELQDLSRFILLQKIAIRKLFKKFLKHSNYQYKQELINKITNVCLDGNPNSFVNLYVNDSILELTLMFDVINNYFPDNTIPSNNNNISNLSKPNSSSSFMPLDTLSLSSSQDTKNLNFSKSTLFDLISKKKGPIVQKFWIHKDNVSEIKFLLLTHFKLISDDSGLIDQLDKRNLEHQQKQQQQKQFNEENQNSLTPLSTVTSNIGTSANTLRPSHQDSISSIPPGSISLKKTQSTVDILNYQSDPQNGIEGNNNNNNTNNNNNNNNNNTTEIEDYTTFKPATTVVSLWLNNLENPTFLTSGSSPIDHNTDQSSPLSQMLPIGSPFASSSKRPTINSSLDSQPASQSSGEIEAEVTCRDISNPKYQSILIAPLGGLRQFTFTALNDSLIKELFISAFMNQNSSDTKSSTFDLNTSTNFNAAEHDESLSFNAVNNSKNQSNLKKKLFSSWQKAGVFGNPKMSQLSLDFCIDNKLKPLAKVSYDRTRFVHLSKTSDDTGNHRHINDNNRSSSNIDCYVTIDDSIKSCKVTTPQQLNTKWSEFDELQSISFPYSILEIRYENPQNKLPSEVTKLINSHLVYKVDDLNFSLNNYLWIQHYADLISDADILKFIAPWYTIISDNRDIRKLPSLNKRPAGLNSNVSTKSNATNNNNNNSGGILLNKNDSQIPSKKRYWNEFDDGSDYENDASFYIYGEGDDDEDDDGFYDSNPLKKLFSNMSLGFLTSERIEKIMQISNKASKVLSIDYLKSLFTSEHENDGLYPYRGMERQRLLSLNSDKYNRRHSYNSGPYSMESDTDASGDTTSPGNHYGSIINNDNNNQSLLTSSTRRQSLLNPANEYYMKPDELLVQIQHDNILAFIYMTSLFLSYLSTGVGMGVIFSVLSDDLFGPDDPHKPKGTNGIMLILAFALLSIILALVFNIFSICLLMSRYFTAPLWHHLLIWFTFVGISTLFIFSIVLCL